VEQDRDIILFRRTADSRWLTIFLFLAGTLASTILLKIGPVQYLEVLYFVEMIVLLVIFSENGYKVRWFRPYLRIAISYILFSAAAFALAILALRYDFYFPDTPKFLSYPVIITASRIIELGVSVSIMLYLAEKFREDPLKAVFTMRVYFWVGVLSAAYSIMSYPISFAGGLELGAYGPDHRMRGFYNEGGPYGLYLISVFLIGWVLYKQKWVKRRALQFGFVILAIGFLGSKSKAAFCAVLFLFLINGLLAKSFKRRVVLAVSVTVLLVAASQIVDLGKALATYKRVSQAYERLSHRHANDPNFVYGRVAGAFIVPKMVSEHPLVGIGWGNYGLLRNAPEYRGAAAFAHLSDEPGLGIAGMTADLGIPLVLYLGGCILLPYIYLRRIKSPSCFQNLALLQPIVHLFGGQLNLTYPWIVTALALGLGYSFTTVTKSSDLAMHLP
jgi:hypothetical protein